MTFEGNRPFGLEAMERRVLMTGPTVIDVMVVYDNASKLALNVDDAGMQKLIRQSVSTANQAHYNTQDNVVLRLVYSGPVSYTSTGSFSTDLSNLESGAIANVTTLRNTFGADL